MMRAELTQFPVKKLGLLSLIRYYQSITLYIAQIDTLLVVNSIIQYDIKILRKIVKKYVTIPSKFIDSKMQ